MVGTVADRLDLFGQQKTQGKTAIPFFSALEKWFSHFSGKCFLIDHIFIGIYYFLFCFPQIFWIFSIEFVFLFANFCIAIWHYLFSTNVSNIIRIKNKRESVPHKWQLSVLDTQCSLTELSLVEKHTSQIPCTTEITNLVSPCFNMVSRIGHFFCFRSYHVPLGLGAVTDVWPVVGQCFSDSRCPISHYINVGG